jgi:tRNA (guanine37-N1)-methyltransferase
MTRIDVITIFPDMFKPVLDESIVKRAQEKRKVVIKIHDLRHFTLDKHKKVDDRPFGGGPGMVMMAQPIVDAVKKIKGRRKARVILMEPRGETLTQTSVKKFAKLKNLIIICGHYEGVDQRVIDQVVNDSISIGDYVLTGGEIPAMVLIDSLIRLLPDVLGCGESLENESFEGNLLEYPHFTRPANFRGKKVPDVLLSGNHAQIQKWRKEQSVTVTKKYRPDLLNQKSQKQ